MESDQQTIAGRSEAMSEKPEFRSFVMDGETCEITMEESGN